MSKCARCRKVEAELDTMWDRVRLFFFDFFKGDILDLSQQKYTQGFSDGYVTGRKHANEENLASLRLLNKV